MSEGEAWYFFLRAFLGDGEPTSALVALTRLDLRAVVHSAFGNEKREELICIEAHLPRHLGNCRFS